jgi:hypothetical protein
VGGAVRDNLPHPARDRVRASLALAAVLLRWRARPSGAEPTTPLGQVPRRFRRPAAIAVAVAGPLMAAYAIGYAATHPLRFDNHDIAERRVFQREPGKVVRYTFRLDNAGTATVTDLSVVKAEGSPALQFDRAGVIDYDWATTTRVPLRSLAGVELDGDDHTDRLTLELRQGSSCPTPVAKLDAVWIRYVVHGMEHEQRVPLVDGPSVSCR